MNASKLQQYVASPAAFRNDLMIDIGGHSVRFGEVMEPWQDHDFRQLDSAWLQAIGRGKVPEGIARQPIWP